MNLRSAAETALARARRPTSAVLVVAGLYCLLVVLGVVPFSWAGPLLADSRTITLPVGRMPQAKLIGWYGAEENDTGLRYRWGMHSPRIPFRAPGLTAAAYRLQFTAAAAESQRFALQLDDRVVAHLPVNGGVFRHYALLVTPSRWAATDFHTLAFEPERPTTVNNQPYSIAVASVALAAVKPYGGRPVAFDPDAPESRRSQLLWLVAAVVCGAIATWRATLWEGFACALVYTVLCLAYWDPLLIVTGVGCGAALIVAAFDRSAFWALVRPLAWSLRKKRRWVALLVWGVFVACAVGRLVLDQGNDTCAVINVACLPTTATSLQGDEPRYVAIAEALATTYSPRLPVSPETFKNGYSMHAIGVPLIIALPVAVGGVWAARLAMLVLVSSIALLAYRWLVELSLQRLGSAVIAVGLVLALPYVPASTQLYPDLLAGVAFLWVVYATTTQRPSRWVLVVGVAALAFVPWLHAKYLLLQLFAAVLCLLGWFLAPPAGTRRLWALLAVGFFVSEGLLLRYHSVAWGNLLGPVTGHSVVLSWEQSRYVLGLLIDQNQGLFAQHPLLLLGVYGLVPLYRASRRVAVLVVVLAAAPIVLNGLHWNIYGGYSYTGRFASTSAVLLLVPACYGAVALARKAPGVLRRLVALSAALQCYLLYSVTALVAMNQRPVTDLDISVAQYSLWYGAIGDAMGMLVVGSNPWLHAGNYAWSALLVALLGYGVYRFREADSAQVSAAAPE